MSQYITAIDLGTCKVSAAVAMRSSSGIKVIGYVEKPSSGVIKGEVVNIKNLSNVLCPLIDELKNQVNTAPDEYPITIKNVYVSISGNSIKCCDQQVKTTRSEDAGLISAKEIDELKERILNEFNEPISDVVRQRGWTDAKLRVFIRCFLESPLWRTIQIM